MTKRIETLYFRVDGMTCKACASTVSRALARTSGVNDVHVDWQSGVAEVEYDTAETNEDAILAHDVFNGPFTARPFRSRCC